MAAASPRPSPSLPSLPGELLAAVASLLNDPADPADRARLELTCRAAAAAGKRRPDLQELSVEADTVTGWTTSWQLALPSDRPLPNLAALKVYGLPIGACLPAIFRHTTLTRLELPVCGLNLELGDVEGELSPPETFLHRFPHLAFITLVNCSGDSLPEQLSSLASLRSLELYSCWLDRNSWEHLPTHWQLTGLAPSHCGLQQLPAQISLLTGLQSLDVGSNSIGSWWLLAALTGLTSLSFSAASLTALPAEGRVLVKIVAAGLNPIDCKTRSGGAFPFGPLTRLPKIPGGDLAGVVEQAPAGSRFKQGDHVFACSDSFFPYIASGTYAELASVAEGQLAPMPAGLSFEEAAVVPLVALTAWQSLEGISLPAGSRILVHGGSGGVGGMAVQLAKQRGWHVTATCSPKNAAYVRQLGADLAEDYADPSLFDRYSQPGKQFDVVLDTVGGSTTRRSLRVLKRRGHLVHAFAMAFGSPPMPPLRSKLRGALGVGPRLKIVLIQPNGAQLAKIGALLEKRAIHPPRISKAFPLDRAGDAHAYFEGGHGAGKVLIKVSQP
ncbi:hypothetical protein ABPG75_012977 [Micractinium tetrahymenae]